jgi:2-isopropylmalate synthase
LNPAVTATIDTSHDWNRSQDRKDPHGVLIHDETLRDGLQNPSVTDPSTEDKLRILHLLEEVGVDSVNVGLPAAGPRAFEAALALTEEIARCRMKIRPGCAGRTVVKDIEPSCAGRTVVKDIEPMVEITQRTGVPIEVMSFVGSSPIRQYVQGWTVEWIRKRSEDAIAFAVKHGHAVTYVTEDTTRSHPLALTELFRSAIDHGAARLCLCDTVGYATPDGVTNLVTFTSNVIAQSGAKVGIDFHGHNDRGFAIENALRAAQAGADRVHGCVLGIGERVGNASLEHILMNLRLGDSMERRNLARLDELCELVSRVTKMPVSPGHPFVEGAQSCGPSE